MKEGSQVIHDGTLKWVAKVWTPTSRLQRRGLYLVKDDTARGEWVWEHRVVETGKALPTVTYSRGHAFRSFLLWIYPYGDQTWIAEQIEQWSGRRFSRQWIDQQMDRMGVKEMRKEVVSVNTVATLLARGYKRREIQNLLGVGWRTMGQLLEETGYEDTRAWRKAEREELRQKVIGGENESC